MLIIGLCIVLIIAVLIILKAMDKGKAADGEGTDNNAADAAHDNNKADAAGQAKAEKGAAKAKAADDRDGNLIPASASEVKLNTVDDKDAAMLLAITAEITDIPLEELKVKSLSEKKTASAAASGNKVQHELELEKKYAYKSEKEQGDVMKYNITFNDKDYTVEVEKGEAVLLDITAAAAQAPSAADHAGASQSVGLAPASGTIITSPLPGTVIAFKVAVGAVVKEGQILAIIEAMKMENEIPSPRAGKVTGIMAAQGATINTGDALLVIE